MLFEACIWLTELVFEHSFDIENDEEDEVDEDEEDEEEDDEEEDGKEVFGVG